MLTLVPRPFRPIPERLKFQPTPVLYLMEQLNLVRKMMLIPILIVKTYPMVLMFIMILVKTPILVSKKSNLGKTSCRICGDSFPSNGELFCPKGCHYGCACCEPPALQVDPDQVPDEPPNHQEVKNWDKEIESFVLKEAEKSGPHDQSLNYYDMNAKISR